MSVPFSNTKLRVPQGFEALLEGFAREVLRSQPQSIIQFGAMYFTNLLKLRKETGHDPVATSAALTDRQYNTDLYIPQVSSDTAAKVSPPPETIPKPDIEQVIEFPHDEALDDAATKIQASYKGYKTRKEIRELKMKTNAATKIQAGIRGHLTRKKIKTMKEQAHETEPSEAEQAETQLNETPESRHVLQGIDNDTNIDIDLTDPGTIAAATKIQASFRGHVARQHVKELKKDTSPVSPNVTQVSNKESSKEQEIDIDLNDPEVEAAALKIQSGFRGYKKKKIEVGEEHSVVADTEEKTDEEKTDVKESLKEQQEAVETPPAAQAEDGEYTKVKSNEMLPNQAEQTVKESQSEEKTDSNAENKDKAAEEKEDANSKKETEKVQNAETVPQTQGETEEVDIDLGDPDVAAAALKIQANFRGNILRKKKKVVEAKKREPLMEIGDVPVAEEFPVADKIASPPLSAKGSQQSITGAIQSPRLSIGRKGSVQGDVPDVPRSPRESKGSIQAATPPIGSKRESKTSLQAEAEAVVAPSSQRESKTSLQAEAVVAPSSQRESKTSLPAEAVVAPSSQRESKTSLQAEVPPAQSPKRESKTSLPGEVTPVQSPKRASKTSLPGEVPPAQSPKRASKTSLSGEVPPAQLSQRGSRASLRSDTAPAQSPQKTSKTSLRGETAASPSSQRGSKTSVQAEISPPAQLSQRESKSSLQSKSPPAQMSPKVSQGSLPRESLAAPDESAADAAGDPESQLAGDEEVSAAEIQETEADAENAEEVAEAPIDEPAPE